MEQLASVLADWLTATCTVCVVFMYTFVACISFSASLYQETSVMIVWMLRAEIISVLCCDLLQLTVGLVFFVIVWDSAKQRSGCYPLSRKRLSVYLILVLFLKSWAFSALTRLGIGKSIQPVKIEWLGVGVVICLEWGADCLHIVQLMALHPKTPSSLASFKSKLVLPFWCQLTQVVLEKRPLNVV